MARTRAEHRRRGRGRGRILAVKWGLNPNSSSLGVDVTFLLFGAAALSLATPVLSALIRWRKPVLESGPAGISGSEETDAQSARDHETAPTSADPEAPASDL